MKKKRFAALLAALSCFALALGLVGCGTGGGEPSEPEPTDVLENEDMTVTSAFIDESYAGSSADEDIKRLYIFSDITASSGTLEVSSASFDLEAALDDATDELDSMDVIQYDTDGGSALANLATSYTCTNTITKILPGSSAKLAIPFNVPSYYLQEGAVFSLSDSKGISDGIMFDYSFIQNAETLEALAQAADNEGYTAAMEARQDASPEVAQDVMDRLNGYEYYQSVGGLTQRYLFEGDRFTASTMGVQNPGTYSVKNGYLACTQDSTGWVTWIPWEFSDKSENGISIDIGELFVEK